MNRRHADHFDLFLVAWRLLIRGRRRLLRACASDKTGAKAAPGGYGLENV